ncbi:glycosyltransferase family 4 protein [Candidatus Kaiserbacteria bacterium]|nr:glycosyltransferase family 4 protein [Candidatus Kaiserbacteria bacterium]
MRILIVTLLYAPDGGPSAPLFQMLCEELVKRGNDVTIIASVPHYPSGRVDPSYQGTWIQKSIENGVKVIRVRIPSVDRNQLPSRMLQFLAFQIGSLVAGFREKYDAVLVTNPSLSKGIPFAYYAYLRNKPSVYFVADVYPDVGIETGIFRNPGIVKLVTLFEKFCLTNSDLVWIFSDSFRTSMRRLDVRDDQLALVYGWVDTDFIQSLPRQNHFSKEYGLDDKFVVLYAGNIGLSQGLEDILQSAYHLIDFSEIHFLFVGDGAGRGEIEKTAVDLQLTNVTFLPFQERSRVPEVLATADVSIVSLQSGMGGGSLPSKTFSYLASGRPILTIVDPGSDTWNLVQRAGAGIGIPPGKPEQIAKAIKVLRSSPDLCRQFSANGRRWALANHSPSTAAAHVENLMETAIFRHN